MEGKGHGITEATIMEFFWGGIKENHARPQPGQSVRFSNHAPPE
jgi:hypothetical protein